MTTISGTTGIDRVQDGSIEQADLAANVAGNGPAFSAVRLAGQAIDQHTFTKIGFNSEEFDTNNNFDSGTGRFTPTVAGYYQIDASLNWTGGTSGARVITLYKNGVRYRDGLNLVESNTISSCLLSALVYLNGTTDYVEIYGYCSGSATLAVSEFAPGTYFSGFLARAA